MPGLRSSCETGGRTAVARSRSERGGPFRGGGKCEPPLEKSTRLGNSRTAAACVASFRLLGLHAFRFALRQAGEQRGDLLAEGVITGGTTRLVRHDPAERERGSGRRGPVNERFGRSEVTGWAIRLRGFVAQIGSLSRFARGVR